MRARRSFYNSGSLYPESAIVGLRRWWCCRHGHDRRWWAIGAGQIATPAAALPTVMGADTAPVAAVITDTVWSPKLVT